MEVGQWFKAFGHSSDAEDYFEVVALDGEERVTLEHIRYSTTFLRITMRERITLNHKELLEAVADNDLFEVSQDAVPFLMVF